jgi:hypothetical protein
MPTTYFLDTTPYAEVLVQQGYKIPIVQYITEGKCPDIDPNKDVDQSVPYSIITDKFIAQIQTLDMKTRAHHIAIVAVDQNNIDVLLMTQPYLSIIFTPDGNAYKLIQLAAEKGEVKMVEQLCRMAQDRKEDVVPDISFATRVVLGRMNDENSDEKDKYFLKFLIREWGAEIWNIFHYSIAWNRPKILDWICKEFADKIFISGCRKLLPDIEEDLDHALDMALRFNSQNVLQYLMSHSVFGDIIDMLAHKPRKQNPRRQWKLKQNEIVAV